jgi:hypothetical protein
MNLFGVLKYKKMGEDHLKNSGVPFTIIRSVSVCFCSSIAPWHAVVPYRSRLFKIWQYYAAYSQTREANRWTIHILWLKHAASSYSRSSARRNSWPRWVTLHSFFFMRLSCLTRVWADCWKRYPYFWRLISWHSILYSGMGFWFVGFGD